MALFRGKGKATKKTIILLSHYDVVGVEDYGHLQAHAFNPETYTTMLKKDFFVKLDQEAKNDLTSGNWLFARGIMDMKAGLAVQIAVLSELMLDKTFSGNIVLVATPDEERNSEGMFSVIPFLNKLKQTDDLEYELCICSEPSFASEPGSNEKYIYTGSVGKLLPLIMCVGKETHVGESLEGLNAGWMAAELVTRMELSNKLIDEIEGERSPPPTCLKITDLKEQYNVQTPSSAYVLYNILTLTKTPYEILEILKEIASESATNIHQKVEGKYKTEKLILDQSKIRAFRPGVFTFSELYEKGVSIFGKSFINSLENIVEDESSKDSRELSVKLASEIANYFAHEAPFYLIMFAPPYYPHVYLNGQTKKEGKILEMVNHIIKETKSQYGEIIKVKTFFNGLSDVSYCRIIGELDSIKTLYKNMPLLGKGYNIPLDEISVFNVPTINIGPFGKDPHKSTERLELNFSTEVFPHILKGAIHHYIKLVGGDSYN